MQPSTTIFALATPPGRAGIAVIRISGTEASAALAALGVTLRRPRCATFTSLYAADGEVIDQGVVVWFPSPASFTGEDIAELQVHSSRAVIQALLQHLSALPGLRLAEAGEFTRRAFLNGKMDLTEAEGLADLIDAETAAQRKQALRALTGHSGRAFERLRSDAVKALALLEAWIDFPEEDIPPEAWDQAVTGVAALKAQVEALLADGARGERIREGFVVVIVGAPNAGKSSLFNALVKRDAAIVSPIPGTTRDALEAHCDIGGYAVTLVDTAGLRASADPIEQEGVRRAQARIAEADITLFCRDGAQAKMDTYDPHPMPKTTLTVITKADLPLCAALSSFPLGLSVSTHTGQGMDELMQALHSHLTTLAHTTETPLITRARHRYALSQALKHLEQFSPTLAPELACEELRLAAASLGKITGKIVTDEVLGHIFSAFCIGK